MITRRDFHISLATAALASLAGTKLSLAGETGGDDLFLNRLTFGANAASRKEISRLGTRGWVEQQLAMPENDQSLSDRLGKVRLLIEYEKGRTEEGKPWAALSEYRALGYLDKDPAEMLHLLDFDEPLDFSERDRPAYEVIVASLVRAVHAPAQLREVMTQFWHEHFSVNSTKDEITAVFFPSYDRMMRKHAFGNFRALLGEVAKSPAMLTYLNNDTSRASPANENYARELLELHTLGQGNYFNDLYDDWKSVPGALKGMASGYIDQDVYEVARAFSGWSIGDGRELDDGSYAPKTGRFHYIESWHDPYQKRILGVEFSPNSAPMEDGNRVLDILAAHPGTADFIAGKMLRRLGIETPSQSYQQHVADVFHSQRDAPDQIAQTLRAIIFHNEFAATTPNKMRRPFEYLAAIYRAVETEVSPRTDAFQWMLQQAGWRQHQVNPPTGHSDHSIDWANTAALNGMMQVALESHAQWFDAEAGALRTPPKGVDNFGGLASHWEHRMNAPAGTLAGVFEALGVEPESALWDGEDLEWASGGMITVLAVTPEFMFR